MDGKSLAEEEFKEYGNCPDIAFTGGHLGGLASCVYCAEIYRRYRTKEGVTFDGKADEKGEGQ